MSKKLISIAVLMFAMLITSCGMSQEEITTKISEIESTYQAGAYEQAMGTVEEISKSYKNMSDEQKAKYDELKSNIDYAVGKAEEIKNGLNKAQSFIDQKLYYEATQELEALSLYKLPPTEQKQFDEKKAVIDAGLKELKITEAFQRVETAYNSGKYDAATNELSSIDVSILSEAQKQNYQAWQTKIATAVEEAKKMVNSVQKAVSVVKQYRKSDGSAAYDEYLGNVYSGEEYSDHYLVKVTTTQNADGQDRYKVYKKTGNIVYLGAGSDW